MPSATTRLPGEPIVIATYDVPLERHLSSNMAVNAQLDSMVTHSSSTLYILIDLTDQSLSFSDILIAMDLLSPATSWLMSPLTRAILVGSHPIIGLAIKRFKQQLGVDLRHYSNLDDALAAVRAQNTG